MDKKMTWSRAVARAYWMFHRRKSFVYLYGCKGETLTKEKIETYFSVYPDHFKKYTTKEKEEIIRNSVGKIGYDCSGFVCKCFDKIPQAYSTLLYSQRDKEFSDYKSSIAGSMLYTTFGGVGRHIGIDLGNGMFAHMGNESTDSNIAKGVDSVRLEWFTNFPNYWEHYFTHKDVDYDGSSADVIEKA